MAEAPQLPPYGGRLLDMKRLKREFDPAKRPPWVVEPLVIVGSLTILAGKMGSGKTWIMHEAANAVAEGKSVAGMYGTQGAAGVIDAEMGAWLTTQRFAAQDYSDEIKVLDAVGWNLMDDQHRTWIHHFIRDEIGHGGFLGIDSLKRLTPSSKENESDDMSRIVSWLAARAKQYGVAMLLIHHAGWEGERIRGSSAIGDPADAVWHVTATGDTGANLEVSCTGRDQKPPRYCPPPKKLGFTIEPNGGLSGREIVTRAEVAERDLQARRNAVRTLVASGTFTTVKAIREAFGVNDHHGMDRKTLSAYGIEQDESGVYQVLALTDSGPAI